MFFMPTQRPGMQQQPAQQSFQGGQGGFRYTGGSPLLGNQQSGLGGQALNGVSVGQWGDQLAPTAGGMGPATPIMGGARRLNTLGPQSPQVPQGTAPLGNLGFTYTPF